MKLTFLLLTIAFLNMNADCFSQTVSFSGKNVSLKKVFLVIEKQTGYLVTYTPEVLANAKPVSINVKNVPLNEFLDKILFGQNIEYVIKGKGSILLSRKQAIVGFPDGQSSSSNRKPDNLLDVTKNLVDVRGRIVDEKGQALAGATVRVKGKNATIATDENGNFTLKNINDGDVLVVSYVGFELKSVAITSSANPLIIALKSSTGKLEEVKIEYSTGYQQLNKERATGSFVQLDNEIINRKVSTNIFDRITEIVPGLNFNPNGIYDSKNALQIRGISTLTSNAIPLIVIDGFAYDNTKNEQFLQVYNYLNNLNPNDVDNITILKDAAAASIWGARSGNGVIVINTKKGKYNQRASVVFNANINISEKPRLGTMQMMTSAETVDFEKSLFQRDYYRSYEDAGTTDKYFTQLFPPVYELLIAKRDGRMSAPEADAKIAAYANHDVRNDLDKYFLQNAGSQQYVLNISGGGPRYTYYTSFGYDRNKRNTIGDESNRFTIRFSNTFKPLKGLELDGNIVFTQTKSQANGISYSNFLSSGSSRPVYSMLADEQGNALAIVNTYRTFFTENPGNPDYLDWQYRPLDEIHNNNNTSSQLNTRVYGGIKYSFIEGIRIDVSGLYERGNTTDQQLYNTRSFMARDMINQFMYRGTNGVLQFPIPNNGVLDNQDTRLHVWNLRAQLNFNRRFKDHEINAITGMEFREVRSDDNAIRRYGYDEETGVFVNNPDYTNLYYLNPDRSTQIRIKSTDRISGTLNRFRSYYANAAYTYKGKYTASGSARQDGANLFGVKANDRVTPFWSAGMLWNISKESFYKLQWLPELKLRASYGFNGNMRNDVTTYTTIRYSSAGVVSGLPGAYIISPPNPSLRWERVKIVNLALDFSLNRNSIAGSLEYYRKTGLDLLNGVQGDPTAIYINSSSSYIGNGASIRGEGIDVVLNAQIINKNAFNWSINFIFSYNAEEAISLGDSRLSENSTGAYYVVNSGFPIIGKPLYGIYSYRWAGLNATNGDPMGYVDGKVVPYNVVYGSTNGVPNTRPQDLVYHGQSNPKYWGSLRNTFRYKQLALSANIVYKAGHYFKRPTINYSALYNSFNAHSDFALRWQKSGDELFTSVPSLPLDGSDSYRDEFYQHSEIMVSRADHIRLQDIRFDYTLSKAIVKRLPFQGITLYCYANNLGVLWTANEQRLDPENISNYNVSPSRILAIGLSVNF